MKLIIEDDDGRKTVVPFARDEISIGRRDGNTIRLTERNVSRRHARLQRGSGNVFLEDLGSYNGVKVNGDRVQGRAQIQEGDLIEIGDYNLAVQLDASDAVAPPSAASGPNSHAGQAKEPAADEAPTVPKQRPQAPPPPAEPVTETTNTAPKSAAGPRPARGAGEPKQAPSPANSGQSEASQAGKRSPTPSPAASPAPSAAPSEPSAPSKAESTAVIRVDLEALNRSSEREPLSEGERPRLVALSGGYAGESFEIDHTSATIGRTVDNDVTIDHRSLSRHHCRVFLDKDGLWKVLDRGSANGIKVNGEDYGLIDLRRGDVIELGHVKLRFCDPGDPFVYSDDTKRAHAAGRRQPEEPAPAPKKSKLIPALVAAGVAGALGVAALVVLVGLGGDEDEAEAGHGTHTPQEAEAVAQKVHESIQAAGDAAESERWDDAIAAYQEALRLDPDSSTAAQGLSHVQEEASAHQKFQELEGFVESESWLSAWDLRAKIPEDSIYSERAEALEDRIREGYLGALMKRARNAFDDSAWDQAVAEADTVLDVAPGHSGATELKTRATREKERELAQARAERERQRRLAAAQKRRAQQKASAKTAAAKKSSDDREAAQEAFQTGSSHVSNSNYRQAVTYLERALSLDPQGQSRAHALLGTSYARLGNSQRAAMHYRRFLETNPNHPQAPQVRQILEEFERYSQD